MKVQEIKDFIDEKIQDLEYRDTHSFAKNGKIILKNNFQHGFCKGGINQLRVIKTMLDQLDKRPNAKMIERFDEDGRRYQCDGCLAIVQPHEDYCHCCGAKLKFEPYKESEENDR